MRFDSLVAVAASLLVILAGCVQQYVDVTIENRSSNAISSGYVEIYDKRYGFDRVEPGGSFEFRYTLKGDTHYLLHIQFVDGTVLERRAGYVTRGANLEDELLIKDNDVTFGHKRLRGDSVRR